MIVDPELEVVEARWAFSEAQANVEDVFAGDLGWFDVSWYGTTVSDERGSFALASYDAGLDDHVGDFLRVRHQGRSVKVYLLGRSSGVASKLALTRRAFMAIALLGDDAVTSSVELLA